MAEQGRAVVLVATFDGVQLGFSGAEVPTVSCPWPLPPFEGFALDHPLQRDDAVRDAEAVVKLLSKLLYEGLVVAPEEWPLVVATNNAARLQVHSRPPGDESLWMQVAFEHFNVPAHKKVPRALAALAGARTDDTAGSDEGPALVLDITGSGAHVAALCGGRVLPGSVQWSPVHEAVAHRCVGDPTAEVGIKRGLPRAVIAAVWAGHADPASPLAQLPRDVVRIVLLLACERHAGLGLLVRTARAYLPNSAAPLVLCGSFDPSLPALLHTAFPHLPMTVPPQPHTLVWRGLAALSEREGFRNAWLSKEEYDESGPNITVRPCF